MECRADKMRWSVDQEGTWVQLLVSNDQEARFYAEANGDKPQKVKITKWRESRSLSANAYAWVLLNKLSAVLRMPVVEIYRNLIPDVGDNATPLRITVEALQGFRQNWENNGDGWIVELIGASDRPGMVDVLAYAGSSTYNTSQMARLIDLIIAECRENEIEYLPPEKISAMLEAWNEK